MDQRSPLDGSYQWARANPLAVDGTLAALATLLLVAPVLIAGMPGPALLSLLLTVPLAWRRTAPTASAAMIGGAGYLQLLVVDTLLPADAATVLSLYALAAYGPARAGRVGLLAAAIGAPVAVLRYEVLGTDLSGRAATLVVCSLALLVVLAAWLLGHLRRLSLQNETRLAERARLLEVEREQEARLAATAERARIAREMHDVVAHSLSVTIAQADGGRYAAASDPAAATTALETIGVTARQALTDMRALLGVLRDGEASSFVPQPDIGMLPDLVAQLSASGLPVTLQVEGQGRPLTAGPELAAYRIVQESLTNALKHGGPNCSAVVQLYWSLNGLTITVTDDGRGAAAVPVEGAETGGQGVLGMRERALLHGGRLDAGPRRGGGYAVRAFLPYVRARE